MNRHSLCSGCGQSISWAYTQKGKRMPLDAEPTDRTDQAVYVFDDEQHIRPYQPLLDGDCERYLAHWVTCEQRDIFRRKDGDR